MKDNKKEKWIDAILESGKQLPAIEVNPFMAIRVQAKLQLRQEAPSQVTIPARWVYASAVGMLLLLVLNVLVWQMPAIHHKTPGIQQVMQEYGFNNGSDMYDSK